MLPGEPVAVRLMNTIWADRLGVHDSLTSPDQLSGWLLETGLVVSLRTVSAADLSSARRLRDALRRLAALRTEDARPAAASPTRDIGNAIETVNAATAAGAAPMLQERAGVLARSASAPDAPAALAHVAIDAIELLTAPGTTLKACQAPGCVLYFVKDHARREWCSPACGNRARAARHYSRHHPRADGAPHNRRSNRA